MLVSLQGVTHRYMVKWSAQTRTSEDPLGCTAVKIIRTGVATFSEQNMLKFPHPFQNNRKIKVHQKTYVNWLVSLISQSVIV